MPDPDVIHSLDDEIDSRDDETVHWSMTDLGGNDSGEYVCTLDALRSAVSNLHRTVLRSVRSTDVDVLQWADRTNPPVAGREFDGSRKKHTRDHDSYRTAAFEDVGYSRRSVQFAPRWRSRSIS